MVEKIWSGKRMEFLRCSEEDVTRRERNREGYQDLGLFVISSFCKMEDGSEGFVNS